MRQPPFRVFSQASAASSHESVVQACGSLQSRALPEQTAAALQVSDTVQKRPSLQAAPVRGVHADVLVPGEQSWHWLPGSSCADV